MTMNIKFPTDPEPINMGNPDVEPVVIPNGNPPGDSSVKNIDGKDYVIDEKGNALNEDGSVFKTKSELETIVTPPVDTREVIEVDEEKLFVEKDGSLVDKDGKVKYTKEQVASMKEVSDTEGALDINTLAKNINLIPIGENNQPITYEQTETGLKSYVEDVYELGTSQGATGAIEELFGSYPVLADVFNYLRLNNGSLDGYDTQIRDYSKIEIKAEEVDTLKGLISEAEMKRGKSKAEADKYVTFIEKDGTLVEEATKAKKYLVDVVSKQEQDRVAAVQEQEKAELLEQIDYWGVKVDGDKLVSINKPDSVYSKVSNGKLKIADKEFVIPEKIRVTENGKVTTYTRSDLFNYIFTPEEFVINNERVSMPRYQYDIYMRDSNKTKDELIFEAFKTFVKNDESQIITRILESNKVEEAKKIRKLTFKSTKKEEAPSKTGGKVVYPT